MVIVGIKLKKQICNFISSQGMAHLFEQGGQHTSHCVGICFVGNFKMYHVTVDG